MAVPHKRYWLTVVALGVLLLPVALLVAGNAMVRHLVTAQLSALDAGDVRIRAASAGLFCHTLRGVSLTKPERSKDPWLTIEKTVVDLPLWRVLVGRLTPRIVLAQGVHVHVDTDGQTELADVLHTAFAQRLPCRTLYVEIDQVATPQQAFTGHTVVLQAHSAGDRLSVVVRPRRGDGRFGGKRSTWFARCRLDYSKRQGLAVVQGLDLPLRSDAMRGISLGPLELAWLQGRAQCDFDGSFRFSELEILNSTLKIDARQLTLKYAGVPASIEGGRSRAVFENGHLQLVGEQLRLAEGVVDVDARLDLRRTNWNGTVALQADGLSLNVLLQGSPYPVRAEGTLSLDAQANLRGITDGVRLEATGQGSVDKARFHDIPAESLDVELLVKHGEFRRDAPPQYEGLVQIDAASPSLDAGQLFSLPPLKPYKPTPLPSGRLSAEGSLTMPLHSITDPETYRMNVRLEGHDAHWRNVEIPHAVARLMYEKGALEVQEAKLRIGQQGNIIARGEIGLIPRGKVRLEGRLQDVNLREVGRQLVDAMPMPPAHLSAEWNATVGADEWTQIDRWEATGTLAVSPVKLDAGTLTETTASIRVDRGRLEVSDARMRVDNALISGGGFVELTAPYRFQAQAEARGIPVAPWLGAAEIDLNQPVQGMLHGTTRADGTVRPWHYACHGTVYESSVTVADRTVDVATLRWSLTPERLEVSDAVLEVAGGQVRTSARIPLVDQRRMELQGRFEAMNLAKLAEGMGDLFPVPQTSAAGDFQFRGRTWQESEGQITFAVPSLKTFKAQMRSVRGRMDYDKGALKLRAEADTLGGAARLQAAGKLDTSAFVVQDVRGTLSWQGVALQETANRLMSRRPIPPLQGNVSGQVDFLFPPGQRMPNLAGELTVDTIAYGDELIARQATAQVVLDDQTLQVQQLEGPIGNGSFRADVQVPLRDPRSASFQARFNRVALRTLQPWLPSEITGVRGSVNAQLRGRAGDVWRGTGTAHVDRGQVGDLSANQVRSAFRWSVSPDSGTMSARGTLRAVQLARGDLRGDWAITWNRRLALQTDLHVRKVDMQSLSKWIPRLNETLRGRLEGHVTLQSRNAESLADWNGSFDLKLRESNIFVLPVISAMAATLGVAAPRSLSVSQIVARGRLRRGNVTVERMTMQDPDVQMWLDGTLSRFGTLDLNVTADAPGAYAVGVVTGLLRPTDLLQRRLLFLHVGGSLRNPVVRPRTEEFLQQELIRFFLPVLTP